VYAAPGAARARSLLGCRRNNRIQEGRRNTQRNGRRNTHGRTTSRRRKLMVRKVKRGNP
jgi:hypothetical protein